MTRSVFIEVMALVGIFSSLLCGVYLAAFIFHLCRDGVRQWRIERRNRRAPRRWVDDGAHLQLVSGGRSRQGKCGTRPTESHPSVWRGEGA